MGRTTSLGSSRLLSTSGSCKGLSSGDSFRSGLWGARGSEGLRKALKGTWGEVTQPGEAASLERGACEHSRSSREDVCSWRGTSGMPVNLPNAGTATGRKGRSVQAAAPKTPQKCREHFGNTHSPSPSSDTCSHPPSPELSPFPSEKMPMGVMRLGPRPCPRKPPAPGLWAQ